MKASDQKKRKTQSDRAKHEHNENRRDDGEFNRGCALLVPR
jgi:hypothetical protein